MNEAPYFEALCNRLMADAAIIGIRQRHAFDSILESLDHHHRRRLFDPTISDLFALAEKQLKLSLAVESLYASWVPPEAVLDGFNALSTAITWDDIVEICREHVPGSLKDPSSNGISQRLRGTLREIVVRMVIAVLINKEDAGTRALAELQRALA